MSLVGRNKGGGDFVPHPAGLFPGTIVDVIDQGIHEVEYNGEKKPPVNKMAWRVYCGQELEDGSPMYVTQGRLTVSTHEKARPRKLVEQSRGGKEFTDEEQDGFDYESLIGKSFLFSLIQKPGKKGGIFTNIDAMLPLMPGQVGPGIPENYVREVNRPPEKSKDVRTGVAPTAERVANRVVQAPLEQEEASSDLPDNGYEFPHNDHDDDTMPWEDDA